MLIERLGNTILTNIESFGRFTLFCVRTFIALTTKPGSWGRWSILGSQLFFIGSKSVPVLALTGAFIGAILAIEGYDQFAAFGIENRLGAVVNISVIKQIGPVLAAVMLAGRAGCALAAELGSMRVTDQIDAMRVMAADPIRVLVAPRVAACVLMIPILTIASNLCGIGGGYVILVGIEGVSPAEYWRYTESFVNWFDVLNGLIKSVFFGLSIGVIACYKGFTCKPGAKGVGEATTSAFVSAFVAIIIINFVLAKLLNDIDKQFISGGLTNLV